MAEQKWFEGLRRQIKLRCGPRWGIDERHGGVRLTRRIPAGKQHKNPRQTVQLGIPWNPAHSGDIFLVVCQIRERMEKGEESLVKAFELQQKQHGATPTVSSRWMTKTEAGRQSSMTSLSVDGRTTAQQR